jgi:hypothetical protein
VIATAYSPAHAVEWDAWVAGSVNGTFLHARSFLAYHGDRFVDASLMFRAEDGSLQGVLPAALDPEDPTTVVSHPGATFGGLVQQGKLTGERCIQALESAAAAWGARGIKACRYKAVPILHHRVPAQDDLYALSRLGAVRYRCDLSSAIDLAARLPLPERRRRGQKRAASLALSWEARHLPALWAVIEENLAARHGAKPVHSLEQLSRLAEAHPGPIRWCCALGEDGPLAGVVLFNGPRCWHAQYIGSSGKGQELSALDAVFEACIVAARESGARYFDFGTSNEDQGRILNEGLYRFKSEFGGGGVALEAYRWEF